jgi:hypothetical protein
MIPRGVAVGFGDLLTAKPHAATAKASQSSR